MDMLKIIENMIDDKVMEVNRKGFIEGGHNGPYYDTDTPVRNTAHWGVIFSFYYRKTNNKKYYDAASICGNYLISAEARPMNANFFCRYDTVKDFGNGTIGAAWAIEGLVEIYKITNNEKFLKVAKEVFRLFPFDEKYKLWKIINVDGSMRGFDMTFNHQLWFAASGILLLSVEQDEEISKRCMLFLDNISNYFDTYKNGLIKHSIVTNITKADKLKKILKLTRKYAIQLKSKKNMKYKENGYHLFNLYAFALIKEHGYELEVFNQRKFKKALEYCYSKELIGWLEDKSINGDINKMPKVKNQKINIYGYSYNAPGFELPYINKVFGKHLKNKVAFVDDIIRKQMAYTLNEENSSFNKNTEDEKTLNSRIYEYIRRVEF